MADADCLLVSPMLPFGTAARYALCFTNESEPMAIEQALWISPNDSTPTELAPSAWTARKGKGRTNMIHNADG